MVLEPMAHSWLTPFAHAAPTRKADLPVKFHAENTPALPASRKGQSGKVLLYPQQDYPAASVDHFCIAVLRTVRLSKCCAAAFPNAVAQPAQYAGQPSNPRIETA